MKNIKLILSDEIHATIEKMTNPALPKRVALATKKSIVIPITDKTAEVLGIYSKGKGGKPFKDENKNLPSKNDLCEALLSGFNKAWNLKESDAKWQSGEFSEIKKICAVYVNEIKRKTGRNVGMFKITKQMMFSAVLHRIVITQDLKSFFEKTL